MTARDLSNLLEQKISNWNQDRLPELEALAKQSAGWSWTCDASGRYNNVSPEVEQALGLPPLAFLKKSLASAQLSRESVQVMHVALAAARRPEDLPLAVGVRFLNVHDQEVPATITLMADPSGQEELCLRGFVQVTPTPRLGLIPVTGRDIIPVTAEQVLTAEVYYQESDYLAASQNLRDLLERLRHITPAILQARESQLRSQSFVRYANDSQAVSHDPERLPLRPPGSGPQAVSYSLEHRLEWGEKLAPSEADKIYLRKHRWASGLLASLRVARAPERMLIVDKSWLHCALHIRPGKPGRLILQVDNGGHADENVDANADENANENVNENVDRIVDEIVIENALDLLLSDAESLLPQLIQALARPRSRTRWAERGVHYLRRAGK